MQPFEKRHGMKACMIAPTKIIAGLGMSLGIKVLHCPGATGGCSSRNLHTLESVVNSLLAVIQMYVAQIQCHDLGKQASTVICAGDYKTQFHAKAAAMGDALINGSHDFGFLHVKAVDDTGHDRAVPMKVKLHSSRSLAKLRRYEPVRLCRSFLLILQMFFKYETPL